jgi:hypothetical protein
VKEKAGHDLSQVGPETVATDSGHRAEPIRIRQQGEPLLVLLFDLAQDLVDHLAVFQKHGRKDGFRRPGAGYADSGTSMEFGPVEEAIKRLLIFFAQGPPKGLPPLAFRFPDKTEGHNCSTYIPSLIVFGHHPLVDPRIE